MEWGIIEGEIDEAGYRIRNAVLGKSEEKGAELLRQNGFGQDYRHFLSPDRREGEGGGSACRSVCGFEGFYFLCKMPGDVDNVWGEEKFTSAWKKANVCH